ncbi:MAG: hypothetical protein ACTSQE_10795 [Candidatus Heimdallarchaeaceae archaeon]
MEGKVKLSINISFEDDEVDSLKRSYSRQENFIIKKIYSHKFKICMLF